MPESFGRHLRDLRLKHPEKMSIREVARRAAIDVSYLSRMEKNEVAPPKEDVILRLAEVLGAEQPDELLRLANKIPPDVQEIIQEHYEELPAFLRTAKDFSQADWNRLTNYVKKNILSRKDK